MTYIKFDFTYEKIKYHGYGVTFHIWHDGTIAMYLISHLAKKFYKILISSEYSSKDVQLIINDIKRMYYDYIN